METIDLNKHQVSCAAEIGLPRLKNWRDRGLFETPYSIVTTVALSVARYLSSQGLFLAAIRKPVALIASKSEAELLEHFARGETRLTIDLDANESAIESPAAVALRFRSEDAPVFSIPLRAAYQRVLLRLSE